MANATSILINVGAKVGPAVSGLDKVNGALKKQQTATGKWQSSLGKAAKFGAAAFTAVGAAAVAGLGLAITKMIEFGKEAVDDELQARRLAETLETLGIPQSAIDKNAEWIASMEIATSVSDEKLRVAVGRLAAQTGDLALAQEQTALATDLAAGANISFEKALKAVQSANTGTYDQIEKYAEIVDLNKDGTIDLSEATAGLEKAYKGAAKAAADRDPWTRIQVLWGNLREALGQWLLPLMDRLAEWFKSPANQKKIQDFINKMGDLSYEIGENVVEALNRFYDWLQSSEGQTAMRDFIDTINDIRDALKSMENWSNKSGGALRWIGAVMLVQIDQWNRFTRIVETVVGWLKTLWEWIQRVKPSSLLKNFAGIGRSTLTVPVSAQSLNTRSAAPTTSNVVNLYGSATVADARMVKRALEGYDVAQGRYAGTPLRVAW